jgi:hypothetical protein
MNAEPEHLASAYLDGELTDEERRLAEGDPAVMAEVESLRALRAEIAAVEPPSAAAREAAITAAMSAFAELDGSGAAVGRTDVAPMRPRRDLTRWLGVAAAVVVAAALGIVATQAGGRGGGDDSAADEAASEPAATSAARVPAADAAEDPAEDLMIASEASQDDDGAADVAGDAESALSDVAEQAEEATAEEATAEEVTAEAPAEATAEESAAEEPTTEAADDTAVAATPTVPLPDPARYFDDDLAIETPIQLQSAAWFLIGRRDAGELGPTPEYRCPFAFVLDRASYRTGGTDFEVLIDVDESSNIVSAVDEATCNVIAESPIEPDP